MTDELLEVATMRVASYQQRTTNLYNRRVRHRTFQVEDLVLRKVFENTADTTTGKFQPDWKGSYTIVRVGLAGSYALNKLDGTPAPRMWNAMHLKRYYQ